jgi:hypothetical protein
LSWILFKRGTGLACSPLAPEPFESLRLRMLFYIE